MRPRLSKRNPNPAESDSNDRGILDGTLTRRSAEAGLAPRTLRPHNCSAWVGTATLGSLSNPLASSISEQPCGSPRELLKQRVFLTPHVQISGFRSETLTAGEPRPNAIDRGFPAAR